MRIPRLYLPGDYQAPQRLELTKEQVHYVVNVLRLKNEHPIEVFNGDGLQARSTLHITGKRSADLQIETVETGQTESPLKTVLVQGISRGDRMDYSLQKAVELGITAIQPVFTERCEVKLKGDKLEKRRQQWQAIVISACEQSGRSVVPEVYPPQTAADFFNSLEAGTYGLVLDPEADHRLRHLPCPEKNQPLYLLIGPEGGLSQTEVKQAVDQGFHAIQLGPRVLRTETAGPAVLAALQLQWGDW